ncbi:hypothetical protein JCM14635_34360 [Megalodesulfovibrio paquesii]
MQPEPFPQQALAPVAQHGLADLAAHCRAQPVPGANSSTLANAACGRRIARALFRQFDFQSIDLPGGLQRARPHKNQKAARSIPSPRIIALLVLGPTADSVRLGM